MRPSLRSAAFAFGLLASTSALAADRYQIGRTPTPEELAGWDLDVRGDGQGLPPGSGSVKEGHRIYQELCATCHGARGEGGAMDQLAGGFGTLNSDTPVRTVGSYWPYATTLFDYIRRAMPFNAPQSLSPDQVYAVAAYVLYLNSILREDAVVDEKNLPSILMPNRNGFLSPDPRPDVQNNACLQSCRP